MRRTLVVLVGVLALTLWHSALYAQAKKPYTIGVSLSSSTNPFFIAMGKGIKEKAEELGVKLRVISAEEDQNRQLDGIQDLIRAKVDFLLVSPITAVGAVSGYEAARKAGIPIFSIARQVEDKYHDGFVGSDWSKHGERIAQWIVNKIGGKGNVALLLGPAGASYAQDMEKGVRRVLVKHPNVKIVAAFHSPDTRADGLRLAEDILTAHPGVNAIYGTNDELALGAVQAAKAAGRKDLVITGFNGVPSAIEAVAKGEMSMTVALKPVTWGKIGVRAAVDHLDGKKIGKIIEIDTLMVDGSNVKTLKREDLM